MKTSELIAKLKELAGDGDPKVIVLGDDNVSAEPRLTHTTYVNTGAPLIVIRPDYLP